MVGNQDNSPLSNFETQIALKDITVIICTRNRARSLAVTLDSIAEADRSGIKMEVRVVDNGSADDTRSIVESFKKVLPITYIFQPTLGNYGKSHALNAALDAGELGAITAVLDDDITVREDWVQAVLSISNRSSDKSIFGGTILVMWPVEGPPRWALDTRIRAWLFSAVDYGEEEKSLAPGRWFSGNHFWFRTHLLKGGLRFRDIWLTEPDFILRLVDEGQEGLASPQAVVWHRIQPELLDPQVARKRARLVGCSFARVRTQPPRRKVKQSLLLRKHPIAGRLFCLLQVIAWHRKLKKAKTGQLTDEKFVLELLAIERFHNYKELLACAAEMAEYRNGPFGKIAAVMDKAVAHFS